jgi:hypothetical protein
MQAVNSHVFHVGRSVMTNDVAGKHQQSGLPDDDFRFADLLAVARCGWRMMLLAVLGGIALALVYLHFATYEYKVALAVIPAASATGGGSGSSSSGLGSLASVVGVSLPGQNAVTPFDLYVESIATPDVAEHLARDEALMREVFSLEWNAREKRWQQPPSRFGGLKSGLRWILGMPTKSWQPPDAVRLAHYLSLAVKVEEMDKKAIATLSMETDNIVFARRVLTALHGAIDDVLRQRALARTEENIRYLSSKLLLVEQAEHRSVLAQVLGAQERSAMLASGRAAYAAEPFGGIAVSSRPVKPRPFIVLALAIGAGLFIGMAGGALRWRKLGFPR